MIFNMRCAWKMTKNCQLNLVHGAKLKTGNYRKLQKGTWLENWETAKLKNWDVREVRTWKLRKERKLVKTNELWKLKWKTNRRAKTITRENRFLQQIFPNSSGQLKQLIATLLRKLSSAVKPYLLQQCWTLQPIGEAYGRKICHNTFYNFTVTV